MYSDSQKDFLVAITTILFSLSYIFYFFSHHCSSCRALGHICYAGKPIIVRDADFQDLDTSSAILLNITKVTQGGIRSHTEFVTIYDIWSVVTVLGWGLLVFMAQHALLL